MGLGPRPHQSALRVTTSEGRKSSDRKADSLWNELQSIRDEEAKQLHVDTYNPFGEQVLDRRYLRLVARATIEILTKLEDVDIK